MGNKISTIRNLGPATEADFERIGILTAEELYQIGADDAYTRLLLAGTRPHFISYYVLVMGLQGRPWNDCKGPEKEALRQRFDALKARVQQRFDGDLPHHIAEEIRAFGVLPARI